MNALKQEGPIWQQWRQAGIGASDAPIILGVSPFKTAHELWQEKTGRKPPFAGNWATRRGIRMEPLARTHYEAVTGLTVQPHCRQHPDLLWMRASLDGITFDGDIILEIKCPGKKDHASALEDRVPEKYWPQIQHQLAVTGARVCHYWSFDGKKGALVAVSPDRAYIEELVERERAFWDCVLEDREPQP